MWSELIALTNDLPADFWPLAGATVAFWLAFAAYKAVARANARRQSRQNGTPANMKRHFSLPSRAGRI